MLRLAMACVFCLLTGLVSATSSGNLFQVDVILFLHPSSNAPLLQSPSTTLIAPDTRHSIALKPESGSGAELYHLLPASRSYLQKDYWALQRNPAYQVLASYSWLQSSLNQQSVSLPLVLHQSWQINGLLRLRQGQYYTLDTTLLWTSPNRQRAFLFSQKQRLKPSTVYYFDNPNAGMLMSVHRVN